MKMPLFFFEKKWLAAKFFFHRGQLKEEIFYNKIVQIIQKNANPQNTSDGS